MLTKICFEKACHKDWERVLVHIEFSTSWKNMGREQFTIRGGDAYHYHHASLFPST